METGDRAVAGARLSRAAGAFPAARVMIAAGILLAACARPQPTVVIDDWWNVDYAKNSCRAAANPDQCAIAIVAEVRSLEDAIATELASNADCKGVRLARFEGPNGTPPATIDAMKANYWSLTLDVTTAAPSQHWGLIQRDNAHVFGGVDTPAQIASKVCAIANGRGATG
jgi:hypothetical protein